MSHNDITGAKIATKPPSDAYREAFDRIFGTAKCTCEPGRCDKPAESCVDWNKRGGGK